MPRKPRSVPYPTKPPEQLHSAHVNIPLTQAQKSRLVAHAEGEGRKITEAARLILVAGLEGAEMKG